MAEGHFAPPAPLLEPGVYLDLPLDQYLADPGIGASSLKMLLVDPPGWRWERPDNPLWRRPESRPQLRGSAAHCAILEGLEAYEARYGVPPDRSDYPEAIDTVDDLKSWLRERGSKLTGAKVELIERVLEIDPEAPIWSTIQERVIAGRTPLSQEDDIFVRLLETFVRSDPALSTLVTGGLPEVSVIWTEGDVRLKARFDYVGPAGVSDLKTFGQPPRIGRTLIQHLASEICSYGYDIQARHHAAAFQALRRFVLAGNVGGYGAMALEKEVAALPDQPPYHWLFVRMGGAPTGCAIPFRPGSELWQRADMHREQALAAFRDYRERFGSDLWFRSDGFVEIGDWDLPAWASFAPEMY